MRALVLQGLLPHKQLRREIKEAKRAHFDTLITKLSHNKQPWDAVKWTKACPTPSHIVPITDSNGTVLSTSRMFKVLHNHFVQPANQDGWTPNLLDPFIQPEPQWEWHPISAHKIVTILNATQTHSTPGHDKIGWQLLKRILNPTTL
ncbi:hypothetical protein AX15_006045 [Amanita polypyramis BW_CC]|nr:hypothetical protein AX15_006045 [Amanita polypyramis BW_CC]